VGYFNIFVLATFCGMVAGSWSAIFLIFPVALLNPKINDLLIEKFNFKNKWWIKLCSVLIPMVIIGVMTPASARSQTAPTQAPSASAQSAASYSSSKTLESLSSSAPSQVSAAESLTVLLQASVNANSESATAAPLALADKLKVHYIDVGQGDSEFIELPDGKTMLIDAGNPENGQDVVNYIKGLGHSNIDYLIATHPHADHIGGMTTVVNGLSIGKIYMPKVAQITKVYENLLLAIKSKGLTVNTAKAGINILKIGSLNIDMIAPVDTLYSDINDYSAVIKITYGSNSFLFMGDAQALSEGQITANVKADVLKVGHHGSNTSTSSKFLSRVSPKYAVIEVGKGNSYGHPASATLIKLQNIGAQVYRTDESGTITITSDGKNITIDKKSSPIKEQAPPIAVKPSQSVATSTPAKSTAADPIVYITNSGEKYHSDGCTSLSKSKIAIKLSDAKAKGYTPCSKCNPPQ
jgi:competence protein ComEC